MAIDQSSMHNLNGNSSRRHSLATTVLRTISLFSGLQVFQVICTIIRTKIIALWIGPIGVGLFSLYNNAWEMISQICGLGVRNAAVRDIVNAKGQRLALIAKVVRRWGVMLGMLGAIVIIAISEPMSWLTFGDSNHQLPFVILSITLFCVAVVNSEQAILQGANRLKRLATASMWGSLGGLLVSIPLYYIWRVDAILPSIVAYSVVTCIAFMVYRAPVPKLESRLSVEATFKEGKKFVSFGFFMTLAVFIEQVANYLFISWLNVTDSTDVVGYYNAGYTLFNKYVGLVFSGIIMEFYPRLTSVVNSRIRTSVFVNHEISILLWVFIPMICVFITIAPQLVHLLYASDFLAIVPFISWSILGTIPRAVSWSMAMTIWARGDSRIFIITESISAFSGLALNVIFYNWMGLIGLGIAYILWYLLYTAVIFFVYTSVYKMRLNAKPMIFAFGGIVIGAVAAASSLYMDRLIPDDMMPHWLVPAIITLIVSVVSIRHLLPILLSRKETTK